jgi:hypothetical protein
MKKIVLLLSLILLSCNATKNTPSDITATLTSECPKNGVCTLEVLKNKSMVVKIDEFGRFYYDLEDSTDKNVIKFKYNKTVKGELQDANYREEIIMEWNGDMKSLSGAAMQNAKLLFGRFCFCKGQTGYYKVTDGKLDIASDPKKKNATLDFKIVDVPQIISHISFSVK